MSIEFDRRHAFYLDTDNRIRTFCAYRIDRLWRGEPDAAMPELANQRVRFAILHIERFTSPPRVALEYYPMLTFDADGNLDLDFQQQQLHAAVDQLEATDYAPATTEPDESATTWRPDPITRRRLIAATTPSYAPRRSEATPQPAGRTSAGYVPRQDHCPPAGASIRAPGRSSGSESMTSLGELTSSSMFIGGGPWA
jgi:hypothetical protein